MNDVMAALKPVGELFKTAKYREGLDRLSDLWSSIPIPKERLTNSYMLVAYGVAFAQKLGDLDLAWDWAQKGLAYSGGFNLAGESEFLVAEVAYARADYEVAKHHFHKVRTMSGKRLFKGKNPAYLELSLK